MKPLASLTAEEACALQGVLFDLDDTVLTHGSLTLAAYEALWRLREGGLKLLAVTGRPSGWGAVVARQWPVDGCVTENGAVYFVRERGGARVVDACSTEERQARRIRLARIVDGVRAAVPEARLTDDVDARRSDVTWDVGERMKLAEDRIRAIVRVIVDAGARWSISSVHLHATYDTDDKASGALRFCATELGEDPAAALTTFAFVGDSGNDAACFGAFRTTFGVANVQSALGRLTVAPRYVATRPMGEGFAEIAARVLALRAK